MRRRPRVADQVVETKQWPEPISIEDQVGPRYWYMTFDVANSQLMQALNDWGSFGWRCHTQAPNKTITGQFDGTVWVMMEYVQRDS